jgi:hypothetical protein
MPLTSLTCPICLAVLKPSQPVAEGARVRCPKCKGAFVAEGEPRIEEAAPDAPPEAVQEPMLDAVEDAAAEDDVTAAPPPRKSRDRALDEEPDRPRKREKIRDDERDEEEDRPRKKKVRKPAIPMWLWLTAGGAGLLLLCGCCGVPSLLLGTGAVNLPGSGSSTASGSGFFGLSFGNTVTMDNYKKIQRGMPEAQVVAILGPPTQHQAIFGLKVDIWQNGADQITVFFDNSGRAANRECRFTNGGITTISSGF